MKLICISRYLKIPYYVWKDFAARSADMMARRYGLARLPYMVHFLKLLTLYSFPLAILEAIIFMAATIFLTVAIPDFFLSNYSMGTAILFLIAFLGVADVYKEFLVKRTYGRTADLLMGKKSFRHVHKLLLSIDVVSLEIAVLVAGICLFFLGKITVIEICAIVIFLVLILTHFVSYSLPRVRGLLALLAVSIFVFTVSHQNMTVVAELSWEHAIKALVLGIAVASVVWLAEFFILLRYGRSPWIPLFKVNLRQGFPLILGTGSVILLWTLLVMKDSVSFTQGREMLIIITLSFFSIATFRIRFMRSMSVEAPGILLVVFKRMGQAEKIPLLKKYSISSFFLLLPLYLHACAAVFVFHRDAHSFFLVLSLMFCEMTFSTALTFFGPTILPAQHIESLPHISKGSFPAIVIMSVTLYMFGISVYVEKWGVINANKSILWLPFVLIAISILTSIFIAQERKSLWDHIHVSDRIAK